VTVWLTHLPSKNTLALVATLAPWSCSVTMVRLSFWMWF